MRTKGLNLPKQKGFIGPALIWKRMAAFVIDILIIEVVLAFPFQSVLRRIMPEELSYSKAYEFLSSNPESVALLSTIMIALSIIAILYFSISEYRLGQSIGKILMNINVVSEKKRLSFWQCIGRSLFLVPAFPLILLWAIDPIFLFFNKKGQSLSEVLTKTRVVGTYTY